MTTFGIDRENNITACGSGEQTDPSAGETEVFGSQQELAALAEKWPTARLVGIWNGLPGVEPVERFTSRGVAVARIWKAIQSPGPVGAAPAPSAATKKPAARKKAPLAASTRAAGQTKTARVIALLERPQGATLKAIMKATDWQTHSVRGFISGHLKKKLGLKVRSSVREGERVYSIKRRS
jgi:hypothetical protein